jgi:hypothetical protein
VGVNDDLQTIGLHEETENPARFRWTGAVPAIITLDPAPGIHELIVEGLAPPVEVGTSVLLRARWGEGTAEWCVPCDGQTFVARGAARVCGAGPLDVELTTTSTWMPSEVAIGVDQRRLGVAISRVRME